MGSFRLASKTNNEISAYSPVVTFNSVVSMLDLQEKQTCQVTLVSPQKCNPEQGIISFLSPLGSALLNKTRGEVVSIPLFGSQMRFQILSIR